MTRVFLALAVFSVCAMVTAPAFALAQTSPDRLPGPPPPCNPPIVGITFHIYHGLAQIYFATAFPSPGPGAIYSDGQSVGVPANCGNGYSISPVIPSSDPYPFYSWASDSGSFSNPQTTQSNVLWPGGTGGLTLVLDYGQSNWGGYVRSGTGLNTVSTTFTLPSSATYVPLPSGYPPPGYTANNIVSIWAGIGGFATGDLVQAGMEIFVTPTGAVSAHPFIEEVDPAAHCCAAVVNTDLGANLGDQIQVSVQRINGASHFSIADGNKWNWSTGCIFEGYCAPGGWNPDSSTVEWVGEAAFCYPPSSPNGPPVQCASPSASTIAFNTMANQFCPIFWAQSLVRTIGADNLVSQHLTPGVIASGYSCAYPGQFSITYSSP